MVTLEELRDKEERYREWLEKEQEKFNMRMRIALIASLAVGALFIAFMFLMLIQVKISQGYVGIRVYLLGTDKGVNVEELPVGRYFPMWNEEIYKFPTFTQNYVWTKDSREGSPDDESISFQTKEGLSVGADVGISYSIIPDKVDIIFQKYRKGVDEITDVFLRNMVRDAFVHEAGSLPIEYVYGEGKGQLVDRVVERVRKQVTDIGINVENIYLIGDMRLPDEVKGAINAKISATQKAQMRENEVREAEAAAQKVIAAANGDAQSILLKAKAQAEANKIIAASLTSDLVQYTLASKWDGILPKVSGDAVPLLNFDIDK
jgi:regulator of protease activity HflC (stomatin/prohibitin superfamily)